jgi:dTDP-4-amino-4,6-dideoxygalactose transaminase
VQRIPIAKPSFGPEELALVQRPLESGWVVQGPYVQEFEQRFGAFTGAAHSIATSSCTTALHLALAVLGVGPGDEVIVPAFTWVATANAVEYMGATPRFCDIELDSFNIDTAAIGDVVGDRTVGIVPVHLFGLCADMEGVRAAVGGRSLWIVEDAACAFGTWQDHRHAGTLGDIGCFSFHPRKSITTGEGGMLTTANEAWAEQARSLRDHGADQGRSTSYLLPDYDRLGYNYRLTDLQAALGCAQMQRAEWILGERRRRAALYDDALADLEWLATPTVPADGVHGYQAYVSTYRPEEPTLANVERLHEERNALMEALERDDIATRPGTHAPVETGYYARKYGLRPGQFPNAHLAERLSLALPLYPDMTDAEQDAVVAALRGYRRSK